MLRIKILILLFTALLVCSCKNEESKVFFGKYVYEDAKLSNSLILNLDSTKVLSGNSETDLSSYRLTDSTLVKGNKIYNFQILGDTLRTYEDNKVIHVFERTFAKTPNLNSTKEFHKILKSQVWQDLTKVDRPNESLEKEIFYQFRDSLVNRNTNYYLNDKLVYSELENFEYTLRQYENHYFILIKGRHSESQYNVLLQLKDVASKKLLFSGIKNFEVFELSGAERKGNLKIEGSNKFVVCNEDILGQYYYKGMGSRFQGGLNKVRRIFNQTVTTTDKESDTGYIRIRFLINCDGEIGRFSILEVDKAYEPTSFSHELVAQLFQVTTTLSAWELERLPQTGKTYDNYRHLTFKIQNGKVLDILP